MKIPVIGKGIDPTHSEVQFKVKHLIISTDTEFVESARFNPIIAGDLSVSGTLERMQLLLLQLTIKNDYWWHAVWKILHS